MFYVNGIIKLAFCRLVSTRKLNIQTNLGSLGSLHQDRELCSYVLKYMYVLVLYTVVVSHLFVSTRIIFYLRIAARCLISFFFSN
jgi:hypothetical protein